MSHDHSHSHAGHLHGHDHASSDNLKVAFFLNVAFTILEIFGGIWTNSIAIITDALHDLGDSASLGLAWYFEHLSKKGRTSRHTYGFKRYRLLGGLITGLFLVAGLAVVLWKATTRLFHPESVNAPGMIALAVVGIVFNGAAVLRMKGASSLTERIVSWHLLEDTLGWFAVLLGAAAMSIWDVPIIDPLLSIALSLFVLWNVARNLKKVMVVFLQSTPESFDLKAFEAEIHALPNVESSHHIHGWSLDGESHVLSIHLVMNETATREQIVQTKQLVRNRLEPEFKHVTIDIELAGEPCICPSAE
ncbi:cation transporter [Luteolibacter pohnpeiensis]|uniref:Cation transporter n=1 Tax=Luteolibacter pohnpeiensis TaxID=454153 RepID=A0A934VQD5_9BACT|nr:cation diffusion facilitator family transporter [Luteolibacter pohnpeiensis]MBK1881991.1 cation transporter [Luteolibacter pohnpeiensis]